MYIPQQEHIPAYKSPSKKLLLIHTIVYLIALIVMWVGYYLKNKAMHGDAYPWESWFTSVWFIFYCGHLCNVFFDNNKDNEDKGFVKYLSESKDY